MPDGRNNSPRSGTSLRCRRSRVRGSVCSPDAHSAAPLSAGRFDVHITTVAGKNVSDFVGGQPGEIAKAVVTSVARLVPGVSVDELDRFEEKVLAWVREHRCHGGEQLRTQ